VLSLLSDETIRAAARTLAHTATSQPARVILFGSYARGDAWEGSDVDFLVIEPEVPNRHAEMVLLRRALKGFPTPVDVMVASEAQVRAWRGVPGVVLHDALAEGRVLSEHS